MLINRKTMPEFKDTLIQFKKEIMKSSKIDLINFWYAHPELYKFLNEQITLDEASELLAAVYVNSGREFFDIYIKNMALSSRGAALINKLIEEINSENTPSIDSSIKQIKLDILKFYLPKAETNATPHNNLSISILPMSLSTTQTSRYIPAISSSTTPTRSISSSVTKKASPNTMRIKDNQSKIKLRFVAEVEFSKLLAMVAKKESMPDNFSLINMFQHNKILFEHLSLNMQHSTALLRLFYKNCPFAAFEAFVNKLNNPNTEKSIRCSIQMGNLDTDVEKDKKNKFLDERKLLNENKRSHDSDLPENDRPFKRARTDMSNKVLGSIPNPMPVSNFQSSSSHALLFGMNHNLSSHVLLFGANAIPAATQTNHSRLDDLDIEFDMNIEKFGDTVSAPVKQAQQQEDEKVEKWSPKFNFSFGDDFPMPDLQLDDQPDLIFDEEDPLSNLKFSFS